VIQTNVIIEIRPVLLFTLLTLYNTKNTAYHITEELIFYADQIIVMNNSKNSNRKKLMLAKYTCFTVAINTTEKQQFSAVTESKIWIVRLFF